MAPVARGWAHMSRGRRGFGPSTALVLIMALVTMWSVDAAGGGALSGKKITLSDISEALAKPVQSISKAGAGSNAGGAAKPASVASKVGATGGGAKDAAPAVAKSAVEAPAASAKAAAPAPETEPVRLSGAGMSKPSAGSNLQRMRPMKRAGGTTKTSTAKTAADAKTVKNAPAISDSQPSTGAKDGAKVTKTASAATKRAPAASVKPELTATAKIEDSAAVETKTAAATSTISGTPASDDAVAASTTSENKQISSGSSSGGVVPAKAQGKDGSSQHVAIKLNDAGSSAKSTDEAKPKLKTEQSSKDKNAKEKRDEKSIVETKTKVKTETKSELKVKIDTKKTQAETQAELDTTPDLKLESETEKKSEPLPASTVASSEPDNAAMESAPHKASLPELGPQPEPNRRSQLQRERSQEVSPPSELATSDGWLSSGPSYTSDITPDVRDGGGLAGGMVGDDAVDGSTTHAMSGAAAKQWTPVRNAAKRSARFKSLFATFVAFVGVVGIAFYGYMQYKKSSAKVKADTRVRADIATPEFQAQRPRRKRFSRSHRNRAKDN